MFLPNLFQDRVIIVTGGGTGIGLATAKRLGELGAKVAIGSRNSANLERGSAELRHAGLDPLALQVDVRRAEQVDEMVGRTVRSEEHTSELQSQSNLVCRLLLEKKKKKTKKQ